MRNRPVQDLSGFSMLELFQAEAENQTSIITNGLLALEQDPGAMHHLDELMRAAHSLKGNAAIVELRILSRVAHSMEDCLVAAQEGKICLGKNEADVLLRAVDFLTQVAKVTEAEIAIAHRRRLTRLPHPCHRVRWRRHDGARADYRRTRNVRTWLCRSSRAIALHNSYTSSRPPSSICTTTPLAEHSSPVMPGRGLLRYD